MEWLHIVWWILGILAVGIAVFILIVESGVKCRVRIKEITADSKIIKKVYKARPTIDKTGVVMWKLNMGMMEGFLEKNKQKKIIPQPPENVIEIDKKGNKWVDCYMFESGEVVFAKDNIKLITGENLKEKLNNYPKHIQEQIANETDQQQKKQIISDYRKSVMLQLEKDQIVFPYEPITTNQRIIYIDNIRKAEQRRNKKDTLQMIMNLALIGLCVMMVIGVVIFIDNLTAPAIKANDQWLQIQQIQTEQTQILRDIKLNQQTIQSKEDNS